MNEKYEVVRFINEQVEIDVAINPQEETIWLNQEEMSILYETTKQNISLHINNILKQNELLVNSTVKETLTVQKEGGREIKRKIKYYNLDMILAVGYRINSVRGIQFRRWANSVLRHIYAYAHGLEIHS